MPCFAIVVQSVFSHIYLDYPSYTPTHDRIYQYSSSNFNPQNSLAMNPTPPLYVSICQDKTSAYCTSTSPPIYKKKLPTPTSHLPFLNPTPNYPV